MGTDLPHRAIGRGQSGSVSCPRTPIRSVWSHGLLFVCLQCRHRNFLPSHFAPWELHFSCSFCYSHFWHRQPLIRYSFNSALQDPLKLCLWPNSKAKFEVSIAFWSLDVTIDCKSSIYSIQSYRHHHWLKSPGFPSLQLYGPGKTNDPLILRVLICPVGWVQSLHLSVSVVPASVSGTLRKVLHILYWTTLIPPNGPIAPFTVLNILLYLFI